MIEKIINLNFWQYTFLGNEIKSYAIAIIAFFVFIFAFKLFQALVIHHLKKLAKTTKTDIDDTLIRIVQSLRPPFYSFLAFYLALYFIILMPIVQKLINIVLIVWVTYQVIIGIGILVDYVIKRARKKEKDKGSQAAIILIGKIVKGILWGIGILLILSNLGVNVTSLVAGLGIGGIAVAFALQNILSDLFSSFAIYFDKPFVPGDFIIAGDDKGVIEKVGIKTTRIRTLRGEELVVSNQELTSTRVRNFKTMQERRTNFSFGVVYETSSEKLERIPDIIKQIFKSTDKARLDRIHFTEFGDFALIFEAVYYVEAPEYGIYRDVNQEILFKIKHEFEKQDIVMAYPTQTIYLEKDV